MTQTASSEVHVKRELPPIVVSLAGPVVGGILGLLIGAVLILIAKANPIEIYKSMFVGAFGGERQITETILQTCPLLFIGLGLAAAFRARVWNIGAEGQYYIGALFGGLVALYLPPFLPRPILLVVMLIAGALGGALWGLIPAVLKVKAGMNEIISTLMLNYIAILIIQYLARGPLQEPGGFLPQSAQFDPATVLPGLFGTRVHVGFLIALAFIPIIYFLLWKTPLGFRLRAIGSRTSVARYAGIKVERTILFALAFSGALAGLGGIVEASTQFTRIKPSMSASYGFTGVLVALLGRMNPWGVGVASFLFAALIIGSEAMHVVSGLPVALADAIQALIVLSVLAIDALVHRRQS